MFTLVDLRSDVRFLVFGNSTNTDYADTDLDRNLNRWYNTVLSWILQSDGDWQVDGEIATADIVANQREYIFPSNCVKLAKLFIKDPATGEYIEAVKRDLAEIDEDPETYYPDTPEFDLFDNSLFIYLPDATIEAVSDGLKLYFQTNLTELLEANDAPNIIEPFKRILSIGGG